MITLDWRSCPLMGGSETEYTAFERHVAEHHKRLNRDVFILEIGSYRGRSTTLLAQFGKVIAVDLWGDVHDGTGHIDEIGTNLNAFLETMRRFNLLNNRVFPTVSTSIVLDLWSNMAFDIIYIDADHHYEPVKMDIMRSESHLAPNGLFIFHDYKREGNNPDLGVNRAVDELLATNDYVIREHIEGLLCLQKSRIDILPQ